MLRGGRGHKLLSAALFLALWYAVSGLIGISTPHEVALKLIQLSIHPEPILGKTLIQHAVASLVRVIIASTIAFAIAVPLGILAGWNRRVREVVMPIVELIRPIPPLAWIPLAYIIFSSFPNTVAVSQLFIVFVGAFFPCIVSVFDAAKNVPADLVEMARVFGATDGKILRSIVLPSSLPGIITGIRVGLGVGWMSIIAAEMVATSGEGLGYFILVMYDVGGRTADIMAGIAAIGMIGYAMNYILVKAEEVLMPWL